ESSPADDAGEWAGSARISGETPSTCSTAPHQPAYEYDQQDERQSAQQAPRALTRGHTRRIREPSAGPPGGRGVGQPKHQGERHDERKGRLSRLVEPHADEEQERQAQQQATGEPT